MEAASRLNRRVDNIEVQDNMRLFKIILVQPRSFFAPEIDG